MLSCKELNQLTTWWQTPIGNLLLQAELDILEKYLEPLFGYRLLIIAPQCFEPLCNASRMGQVWRLDPNEILNTPLPTNLDAILIPHLLSYTPEIEAFIQDCWQNLEVKGQLIVTGYNRFSYLAWYRFCHTSLKQQVPLGSNSKSEIKRLLQANLFNIIQQESFAPLSITTGKMIGKVGRNLFANAYVICAQKELTLVKINDAVKWQKKRKVVARVATTGCQREQS